jgi:S-adenosylmethionine:tRNA ribosyltransferase-isomerase
MTDRDSTTLAFDIESYAFDLPVEAIAQAPADAREASRLLVLEGSSAAHTRFAELPTLLRGDEVLVVNDTRVVPARLLGRKESGGQVELLVLPPGPDDGPTDRACMCRTSRPLREGARVLLPGDRSVTVVATLGGGRVRVDFAADPVTVLEACGQVPLPPYIRREAGPNPADLQRYQTVYAGAPGAVAAPTAGLHFTPTLLEEVAARGVPVLRVTLHVGPGTFEPVRATDLREHAVGGENVTISEETAAALAHARREGRRVLAVGTTTVRTLEGSVDEAGAVRAGSRRVDLTIRPGHAFRVVDQLVTNFHLPRSSLLVLVAAFAGRERVLSAYADAVARGYRFYSYGDAMLIR